VKPILPLAVVTILCAGCIWQPLAMQIPTQDTLQESIEALPTPPPRPTPIICPTAIAVSLSGIFCEYEFCIGHPKGFALFDVVAKQNPNSPEVSKYEVGKLATYGPANFIQVIWQTIPPATKSEYLLDLVIDDSVDIRIGPSEPLTVAGTNATIVPLTTTTTKLLPFGSAAAWLCGGRGFAWKAYAREPALANLLLTEALRAFRCEQ
jgi:hypothetical protein